MTQEMENPPNPEIYGAIKTRESEKDDLGVNGFLIQNPLAENPVLLNEINKPFGSLSGFSHFFIANRFFAGGKNRTIKYLFRYLNSEKQAFPWKSD